MTRKTKQQREADEKAALRRRVLDMAFGAWGGYSNAADIDPSQTAPTAEQYIAELESGLATATERATKAEAKFDRVLQMVKQCEVPIDDREDKVDWIAQVLQVLAMDYGTAPVLWEKLTKAEAGLSLAVRKAKEEAFTAVREILQGWHDAYPEDVPMFAKLPNPFTESREMQVYRTRVSAGMGRHMSKVIIEQINQLETETASAIDSAIAQAGTEVKS